jgi:diguanylate cyclase (GGDEF)-like protein/PAS domain S-box-containing protein
VDLRTVMLMLAVGSYLFGLLILLFRLNKNNPYIVPFWVEAKMLQATGSLMLYFRTGAFDGATLAANTVLLLGCAYEAWAIRILSGQTVKRRQHILTSVGIILACSVMVLLDSPYWLGLVYLMQSIFYFLPSLFLFSRSGEKFSLRALLAACYCTAGAVFLAGAVLCLGFPQLALVLENSAVFATIPAASFCLFLISSFILLMLAKERSDRQVLHIQKRFQQVVETAVEGIIIFDKHYRIIFANENMAAVLGYRADEMLGRPYISFFPESQLHIYHHQAALRKKGQNSVYECRLLTKSGQEHWFLVSATAIVNDSGEFDGYFAMLTDINDRKEMELLLEESNRQLQELSNRDGLTGIANRRLFDATLEHEYSRLRRTRSKLSIILFDVDHFKEYNDYYGHVMGDECLRRVAAVLTGSVSRSLDLAARYGGDEFACILPDTDLQSAVKIAEKIRQRILDLKIEHKKSPVSDYVTASFGVTTAVYSPETTLEEIIATADELLYKAKASRNRIEFAEWKNRTANENN